MDMDRYIGRLLDNRYEILEVLGTGGMAVVYKARCHRLNRLVAIKILKDDYTQDEEFRRRFQAESQAVAMLSHPNIVSVYDVSTTGGADYIVMELIDGITLKQYMEKKGTLNWKETLHFAIQIGKALEHAHSRGIVHRDIKPHNVMVLKNGSVKVTDFGIARVMSKSNTLTKEALGSVHYISPEQAKGGRVDSRSDIYSLGVVMYEMMTGRPPYDGESPVAIAIQHINGKAAMPSTLNPNMPGGLEQIIMKAMEQEPARRYETASAMLYDMDEFRKDPTILFDYNNASAGMDDATLIQSKTKEEEIPPAKNTAERIADKRDPAARKNTSAQKKRPGNKPRRRQEEIIEDEEKSNKVATIAVIACSVVLVLAIVIILVVGLGSGNQDTNLVMVPNMLGKQLADTAVHTDITINVNYGGYSDDYEKDEIIDQNPAPNTQIAKGGSVTVTVSLGPEPKVKTMEKLVELSEDQAKNFLINTQGINPELIMILQEPSATVKAGSVTRTEPVEGGELVDGAPVRLWISTGPAVKTAKMPNVIGHNVDTAIKLLNNTGFMNVTKEEVESNKTPNTVLWQSVKAEMEVDVTTPIVLQIPISEQQQDEKPTIPVVKPEPDDYVSKWVTIPLPEDMVEDYVLSVRRDGAVVEEREIPAGAVEIKMELFGKGKMTFEVWVGNVPGWSLPVDFDEKND